MQVILMNRWNENYLFYALLGDYFYVLMWQI